jgi:hypothetical protein
MTGQRMPGPACDRNGRYPPSEGMGIHTVRSWAKERPQVVEPVEQMPHVRRGACFPVWVQICQRGILAVALEGRPGLPLDENEHLPGSYVACRALPEPAQGQHAPSVPDNLTGRPARIGQVLLTVSDIEQVERVDLRLLICHILTLGQRGRAAGAVPRAIATPLAVN